MRPMRHTIVAALVGLLTFAASACGERTAEHSATDLLGTWWIQEMTVAGDPFEFPNETPMGRPEIDAPGTLEFLEDGRVVGAEPCNGLRGRYSFDGRALTLSDFRYQAVLCTPEQVMEADALIFGVMTDGVVDVAFDDGDLLHLKRGNVELTLRRAPQNG